MVPCLKGSLCFTAPFLAARNGWGIKEDVTISTRLAEKLQEPFFGGDMGKKVMETARKHHGGKGAGRNARSPCKRGEG